MNNLIWMFFWGMIQNKLQQMGIPTQWVNFNDMNSLNDFAQKILPWILKSNPQAREMIKNSMGNFDPKQKEEIVKIIDNL